MEEIESYAPYEEVGISPTIKVSVPSGSGQSPMGGEGSSGQTIILGGGGDSWKDYAFEALDFYG